MLKPTRLYLWHSYALDVAAGWPYAAGCDALMLPIIPTLDADLDR